MESDRKRDGEREREALRCARIRAIPVCTTICTVSSLLNKTRIFE